MLYVVNSSIGLWLYLCPKCASETLLSVILLVTMAPKLFVRNDQDFITSLLGASQPLNPLKLPTTGDVLRGYNFIRNQMKTTANEPTGVKSKIVDEVIAIWDKASIPTVTRSRVIASL